MLVDAHIHLFDCKKKGFSLSDAVLYLSSSSSLEEFKAHDFCRDKKNVFLSAGVHPWYLNKFKCDAVEALASSGEIVAVGECGIDLYTPELVETLPLQRDIFANQIAIAQKYNLPLVIHERKGLQEIMQFSKELSRLSSVIFHSWSRSSEELREVLSRDINAFFSVGTTLFRNSQKMQRAVEAIPMNRLLTETDAPFQPPPHEKINHPGTLSSIVGLIATIKKIQKKVIEKQIAKNIGNILL